MGLRVHVAPWDGVSVGPGDTLVHFGPRVGSRASLSSVRSPLSPCSWRCWGRRSQLGPHRGRGALGESPPSLFTAGGERSPGSVTLRPTRVSPAFSEII